MDRDYRQVTKRFSKKKKKKRFSRSLPHSLGALVDLGSVYWVLSPEKISVCPVVSVALSHTETVTYPQEQPWNIGNSPSAACFLQVSTPSQNMPALIYFPEPSGSIFFVQNLLLLSARGLACQYFTPLCHKQNLYYIQWFLFYNIDFMFFTLLSQTGYWADTNHFCSISSSSRPF